MSASAGKIRTSVRLFALYREQAGASTVEISLAPCSTVADLLAALEQRFPRLRLHHRPTLVAVNAEYAPLEQTLREGDEVALIPPVSGGAPSAGPGEAHVRVTTRPLNARAVADSLRRDTNGAVVLFEGVTRRFSLGKEVLYLEYEAFVPLAEREMARIAEEVRQKWGVQGVAIEHRIGRVEIGETSLVVAVASPHRREAFAAAAEAVDRIKQTVPIWKKELFADGAVWVESEETRAREQSAQRTL